MAKRIVISAVCYMCHKREPAIACDKPTPLGKVVVKNECMDCDSINTYRVSIRGQNLKVETIYVSASPDGRIAYQERTGDEFTSDQAKQD